MAEAAEAPVLRASYGLLDVSVLVETDESEVLSYLDEFYPRARPSSPSWTVRARVSPGTPDMRRNPYGVGLRADPDTRVADIAAPTPRDLRVVTRRCLREVMIARCETANFTMLHASAIASPERVVVFAADKRAGKTTLALRAALEHGWQFLSNDHLIVFPERDHLVLTSLPTLLPVKVGTVVDIEHLLPAKPFDDHGLDVARWRPLTRQQRYATDTCVYYTYRQLGHDNPVALRIDPNTTDPEVVVIFPSYAQSDSPATEPEPATGGWRELAAHTRLDWVFDPGLNHHYLPRQQREPLRFMADSRKVCRRLGRRARFLRWEHHGDPTPLLRALSRGDRP